MPEEAAKPLVFLRAKGLKGPLAEQPYVAIVRSRDELSQYLQDGSPNLQWIQVEELMEDAEGWALAAHAAGAVPLDVVLSAPGSEYGHLYRLVDVVATREVRISMPATPGFLKALRLAASLGLPVRILPGQPSTEAAGELAAALEFYLHDPMVEAPIEFFHSVLSWMCTGQAGSLWTILEEDPAIFCRDAGKLEPPSPLRRRGEEPRPRDFVSDHLARLTRDGAECATCSWQQLCQGYFKLPEPGYSCREVKRIFSILREAADEIGHELADHEAQSAAVRS
jgi:hypothetical protein